MELEKLNIKTSFSWLVRDILALRNGTEETPEAEGMNGRNPHAEGPEESDAPAPV